VTATRRDPPRRVTPEILAFYRKQAVRLQFEARRDCRRRIYLWLLKRLQRR
jgi:hypothetical protein